ncbi:hypothetical protein EI427_07365 [Flammeovirga pectinis]|uniref:DUF7832 domain-containing protein n=1 Tax=Flammeovirga pectinis TaxID=2494373 RepID=A0A3S9P1K4_9BACT|nr:hypothetical protein [Flammeovirga pectinis]AZQ62064.1 hypothetical protein EI427_07365 [Flammeovirga pectinis]
MYKVKDSNSKIIDNAKDYFGVNFPDDQPLDQAYLHIGIFIGWAIEKDFLDEEFNDEFFSLFIRFKNRDITSIILAETLDGVVEIDFFNTKAQDFVRNYYSSGEYVHDYKNILGKSLDSIFHVEDSWKNYDTMKAIIEKKYMLWLKS